MRFVRLNDEDKFKQYIASTMWRRYNLPLSSFILEQEPLRLKPCNVVVHAMTGLK